MSAHASKKAVKNGVTGGAAAAGQADRFQKPLIICVPVSWTPADYSLKAVDEEEEAEAEAIKAQLNRPAEMRLSESQSGVGKRKRFYVVPDWAGAVTSDFVERAVLGVVDYWLGLDEKGKIRARGHFLTRSDGSYW